MEHLKSLVKAIVGMLSNGAKTPAWLVAVLLAAVVIVAVVIEVGRYHVTFRSQDGTGKVEFEMRPPEPQLPPTASLPVAAERSR